MANRSTGGAGRTGRDDMGIGDRGPGSAGRDDAGNPGGGGRGRTEELDQDRSIDRDLDEDLDIEDVDLGEPGSRGGRTR